MKIKDLMLFIKQNKINYDTEIFVATDEEGNNFWKGDPEISLNKMISSEDNKVYEAITIYPYEDSFMYEPLEAVHDELNCVNSKPCLDCEFPAV